MKDIFLILNLFSIFIFMSCVNKSSNNLQYINEKAIALNEFGDSIKMNTEKKDNSTLVLKVKVIKDEGGDKFNWVKVKVLSILKNDTEQQIPESLSIASYSWLSGLQEGKKYIVYLVPFPLGSEKITDINQWILLEGNASIGAEFVK